MTLEKMLGFPLEPARIDPDGASLPPNVSALAPPSQPVPPRAQALPAPDRFLDATHIEGLAPPPAPPPAPAGATALERPREPSAKRTSLRATQPGGISAPSVLVEKRAGKPPSTAAPTPPARRGPAELRAALLGTSAGRFWFWFALGSALSGLAVALAFALWLHGSIGSGAPAEPPGALRLGASGVALAPHSPSLSVVECVRQHVPERVASGVSPSLPLEAAAEPDSVTVLIGTALEGGTGLGLELNASSFEVRELTRDESKRELLGMVPMASGAQRGFLVDRATVGGHREARSLPDQAEWLLARSNRALELVERSSRRATALWPLSAEEEIGRPKVAWQDAEHLAVVLRHGSPSELVLGWLEPRTGRHSELRPLSFSGPDLGVPSLAVAGTRAAVAAAVRDSNSQPWRVELVASEGTGEPHRVRLRALETATDLDRFAPSLSALGEARWFLQWTEGAPGARRVRGLTLDRKLNALGAPLELSRPGTSAGAGVVVPVDEGLISLFLVQRGAAYELWATTLSCR